MIRRHAPWVLTGAGLCVLSSSVLAALSTGTIVRITDGRYTIDAGKSDGLSLGQELTVLKNGEAIGKLKLVSLREHDSDSTLLSVSPGVVIRVGDTVTYEPGAAPPPTPEPPTPEPPVPNPPTPEPPAPEPPTPVPPTPEPPAPVEPMDPVEPDVTPPAPIETPPVVPVPTPTLPQDVTIIDLRGGGPVQLLPPTEETGRIVEALVEQGFENVVVRPTAAEGLYIEFENRRYRWEVEGLGNVMRTVTRIEPEAVRVTFVGKHRGVPLYQVEVTADEFRRFLAGEISDSEFRERMEVTWPDTRGHGGANPSYRRVDATLGYGLRMDLTSTIFRPPSDPQLLLRLGLESDLFKGFRARFREWIPLNEASAFSEQPSVAEAQASYLHKFSRRLYGHVAAGTFQQGLSALRGEATYFVSPGMILNGQIGRVGTGLGNLRNTSYLGTIRRNLPNADASLYTTFGKYIYGDRGRTLGLVTRFREREYEFAYAKTNADNNLSFTIRWPIGNSTYPRPKALRFRREPQFRFTYFSESGAVAARLPSEGFADNWQVADMPGTLPHYVSFLKDPDEAAESPRLQERVRDVPLSRYIGTSLSGSTGLWFVPAAEAIPYGYWTLGANWVDRRYRTPDPILTNRGTVAQYFTFGALPRLELTLRITNLSGKLGAQKYFIPNGGAASRGYNIDRMVSAQYELWSEKGGRPAALIGGQDFLGDFEDLSTAVVYKAYYAMLRKQIGGFGVHAGLGTDTLKGVLRGVDRSINDRLRLMLDHQRGNTTAGLRLEAIQNVRLDLYAPGLNTFGA
ncbi:MAG: YjbH domain-containing protein, partial [Armatimonadetes bacterium]|nr:YjbH domain-containing protein [Armatimonadota bacterium]